MRAKRGKKNRVGLAFVLRINRGGRGLSSDQLRHSHEFPRKARTLLQSVSLYQVREEKKSILAEKINTYGRNSMGDYKRKH